jgi:hypothetical protein
MDEVIGRERNVVGVTTLFLNTLAKKINGKGGRKK